MLKGVRLAYAHMHPHTIKGEDAAAGALIMLDHNDPQIKAIQAEITRIQNEENKGERIGSDKYCLRSSVDRGRSGELGDCMVLSANAKKGQSILTMGKGSTTPITNSMENPIYSGCYANVKVRFWWQDNNFGKRINASLVAVQFAEDGDPLDGAHVSPEEAAKGFEASGDASGSEWD